MWITICFIHFEFCKDIKTFKDLVSTLICHILVTPHYLSYPLDTCFI